MHLPTLVKSTITNFHPGGEVILFGSRARGDHQPDSDWDFLILLEQPVSRADKTAILDALYELELETETVISALVISKPEWHKRSVMPLYQNIQQEGVAA